ncbi:MAG: hypothetical protein U0361_05475 [Nitrospiraceae bacterium]
MAVLKITKLGNPILRQQSQAVDHRNQEAAFQQLIDDIAIG